MGDLKLNKYEGILEQYHETGMECLGIIFHDNRGNHEGPKYDNPNETMVYRSIGWTLWFNKKCTHKIKIFDDQDNVVYQGPLTIDRKAMSKSKYHLSFIPKEIDKMDWLKYSAAEYRAELYTNEVPYAIKEKFGSAMPYQVGDVVKDDLTGGTRSFIMHMSYTLQEDGGPGTLGYWINSDHLGGARHPWELSDYTIEDVKKEMEKDEEE